MLVCGFDEGVGVKRLKGIERKYMRRANSGRGGGASHPINVMIVTRVATLPVPLAKVACQDGEKY